MKIIECPRDAMQGMSVFIPTGDKIRYINQLLKVGFDTIDFGSFVSPKVVPQMRDTSSVLKELDWAGSATKLLAIVANLRGAEDAAAHAGIAYLGFPLSVSETFQQRNTNKSIEEAFRDVEEMQQLCTESDKTLVVYVSMGFGNPYGDPYDVEVVNQFVKVLHDLRIRIVSLADTIGVATPEQITSLFKGLSIKFPSLEIGVHLHSNPATAREKIEAGYKAGCRRFDGALKGFGGCPMAEDTLVGNVATEMIVEYLREKVKMEMDEEALNEALRIAAEIFPAG